MRHPPDGRNRNRAAIGTWCTDQGVHTSQEPSALDIGLVIVTRLECQVLAKVPRASIPSTSGGYCDCYRLTKKVGRQSERFLCPRRRAGYCDVVVTQPALSAEQEVSMPSTSGGVLRRLPMTDSRVI